MNKLAIVENALAADPTSNLPTAAWDLISFLSNAKNYGNLIGGGVAGIAGLILVIVAIVFIAKKFLGNGQGQEKSWVIIVLMLIIGGALLTGGFVFIANIASGGQKTIEELGGGFIVLPAILGLG
jgi:hypothetical protein